MDLSQFEQLVARLLATDNEIRKQAENTWNEIKGSSPDFLVLGLLHLIRNSTHEEIRAMAAVLLRRVVGKSTLSVWANISAQTQQTVKLQLLEAVEVEKSAHIRYKLGDCTSELAIAIIPQGQWNELLPWMFKLTQSSNDFHREVSLQVFSQLAQELEGQMRPHFSVLKGILTSGLNDNQSLKVRIAALTATANFLQVLGEPEERQQFQQLTPLMLGVISSALNAQQEEEARTAIELFVDLAELDPTFLKPHLATVVHAMITISTAPSLEDSTKQLGIEFLVTLAESRPGMTRKLPKFVETMVPIILNLMVDIDDDTKWDTSSGGDEVEITNADVGEEALDRLAIAIGGKSLVPIIFAILPALFKHNDWKHRHTGLMAVSIIGEGCNKAMQPHLADIIKTILPFYRDPHPRVRWALCNALGQMSTDFGPDLQSTFHADVIPALVALMDDKDNPRVQSHAASSLINFCEAAQSESVEPYINLLVGKLLGLLQGGRTVVQEQAVTALAAIADCVEHHFIPYYDTIIPYLKSILSNANAKEYRTLRGKAMECVTLIGVAVGKEKFGPDAKDIMQHMITTQLGQLESDDPQISFLLQSWARICKCLGQDFVPYVQYVMPPLLKSAKIHPDITVTDSEGEQRLEGWDFIPVGDARIGINTSALEEKATACNMLYCYASELKEGFFPYVDEVAKLLVPLMRFFYHEGVRNAAVTTMPHLLHSAVCYFDKAGEAAKGAGPTYIKNLWNFIFTTLMELLKEEIDLDMLLTEVETWAECLPQIGASDTEEQLAKSVEMIAHLLKEVHTRRQNRLASKHEDDHDDEEEERLQDEDIRDEEIVSQLAEVIGQLLKSHKEKFFKYFDLLVPMIQEMLQPSCLASDRQAAICIFDDLVDYTGPLALGYFRVFLPLVANYIRDANPAVRQAAVYGVGLCAEHGGEQIASSIPELLNGLCQVIMLPDARTKEFANPTENAIAAVGKILKFHTNINQAQAFPLWLSWLPVVSDHVESFVTYTQLCTFIESGNRFLLGENYENIPKILNIFGTCLETKFINDEISKRISNILKQLQSSMPSVLQSTWTSLTKEQQEKLTRTMSTQ